MEDRRAYVGKLEAQLRQDKAAVEGLKAEAERAEGTNKIQYQTRIEDLLSQIEAVEHKIEELKHSKEEAWEGLKEGIESAWGAFKNTLSIFKYMDERRVYIGDLEEKSKEGKKLIEELEARVAQAAPEDRPRYNQEIEALHAKLALVEKKIQELRASSGEAWGSLKEGGEKAWQDLKEGITQALSRF
jgi:chromosome segregation ATPase